MYKTLKTKRESCGKTQGAFAEELGISKEYYGRIERGVLRPSPKLNKKIKELCENDLRSDAMTKEKLICTICDKLKTETVTERQLEIIFLVLELDKK